MDNNSNYISPSLVKIYKYASEYSSIHKDKIADFIILDDNYDVKTKYLLLSFNNYKAVNTILKQCNHSIFNIREVLTNNYLKLYCITIKPHIKIIGTNEIELLINILLESIMMFKVKIDFLVGKFDLEQEASLKQYDAPAKLRFFTTDS